MIRRVFTTALLLAATSAIAQNTTEPAAPPAASTPAVDTVEAVAPVSATAPPAQIQEGDQLKVTELVIGKGAEAAVGSNVSVHYTGWLFKPLATKQRGKKFDSSLDRGEPIEFMLGAGRVIKGWDQGLQGMRVGGKRTLVIPARLAYGARAQPGIPANSDLVFDVELVKVN